MATHYDSTTRASAWTGTLNNPTEEERVAIRTQQRWLKSCKGQDEIGAETGTLHIQFTILTDQIRMSTLKAWLPRAHWKPQFTAKHRENGDTYVSKSYTSVPGTQFHYVWRGETDKLSVNKLLVALYSIFDEIPEEERLRIMDPPQETAHGEVGGNAKKDPQRMYYHLMSKYLMENPDHSMMFGNRMVKELWMNCLPAIRSWWEADRQTTLTCNLAQQPTVPLPAPEPVEETDRQTPSPSESPAPEQPKRVRLVVKSNP